jgi:glycolate oxidase
MILSFDIDDLVRQLPDGTVVTDEVRLDKYRRDRSQDPDVGMPLAAVRPTSVDEIQTVVRFAAKHQIPIVPRGAGSGLSGGASAFDGCLIISTERMTGVVVDPLTRTAVVQPGALNAEVKAAAAQSGLWYPPDPSSYEICSIGGNIATNAGGLCCVKYGVTTDYVLALTVVLADGTVVKLGGPRVKDVAGLSLTKLFVGGEGTLGIIAEATVRLLPAQRPPATLVASFPTLEGSMETVLAITRRMRPSMLEFMDRASINAVEDELRMGLDRDAEALLVIQSDEPGIHAAEEVAWMTEVCEANGALEVVSTDDPETGEAFVVARRMAIPAVEKKGSLLLEDVGVPLPKLGTLVGGIARIANELGLMIAVIAHAGDGNTHPLIVFDAANAAEAARGREAYGLIMDLAIELGGTITGEHGVGRVKLPWLANQLSPEVLELNRRVKSALDPDGIMNPGAAV